MTVSGLVVREATWSQDHDVLSQIRLAVFVLEQHVPTNLELDGLDASAIHFLAFVNERPVGTSRLLPTGQIGRMAVLAPYRSQGIGGELLRASVARAVALDFADIFLHAQISASAFYQRNGFQSYGSEFEEAGILHQTMRYKRDSKEVQQR